VLADEALVLDCLRKDRGAWSRLFQLCQPQMMLRVRSLLRQSRIGEDLAEEVVSQVWLAVISDDGRLLRRFDARKCARVSTYLNAIAAKQTLKHLRSSRRRKFREAEYGGVASRRTQLPPTSEVELSEFLQVLTPRERQVCVHEFLSPADPLPSARPKSESQKIWQLRHRIRRKFLEFFRA